MYASRTSLFSVYSETSLNKERPPRCTDTTQYRLILSAERTDTPAYRSYDLYYVHLRLLREFTHLSACQTRVNRARTVPRQQCHLKPSYPFVSVKNSHIIRLAFCLSARFLARIRHARNDMLQFAVTKKRNKKSGQFRQSSASSMSRSTVHPAWNTSNSFQWTEASNYVLHHDTRRDLQLLRGHVHPHILPRRNAYMHTDISSLVSWKIGFNRN